MTVSQLHELHHEGIRDEYYDTKYLKQSEWNVWIYKAELQDTEHGITTNFYYTYYL
jgi:hypothetical protein